MSLTLKQYRANGMDHVLQKEITDFMHRRVMEDGRVTLANLGYLHMNTIMFNLTTQAIELKVYFDPRFSCRVVRDPIAMAKKILPVSELNIFSGYLFIGDVQNVITFEKIHVPKTKYLGDELKRSSLRIGTKIAEKEESVAVMNCSFPLTMAAINGINLGDSSYKPTIKMIAGAEKDPVSQIVPTVSSTTVPVSVAIQYSDDYEKRYYDPADVDTYMTRLSSQMGAARENRIKVEESVRNRAKKNDKKSKKGLDKSFNKYS